MKPFPVHSFYDASIKAQAKSCPHPVHPHKKASVHCGWTPLRTAQGGLETPQTDSLHFSGTAPMPDERALRSLYAVYNLMSFFNADLSYPEELLAEQFPPQGENYRHYPGHSQQKVENLIKIWASQVTNTNLSGIAIPWISVKPVINFQEGVQDLREGKHIKVQRFTGFRANVHENWHLPNLFNVGLALFEVDPFNQRSHHFRDKESYTFSLPPTFRTQCKALDAFFKAKPSEEREALWQPIKQAYQTFRQTEFGLNVSFDSEERWEEYDKLKRTRHNELAEVVIRIADYVFSNLNRIHYDEEQHLYVVTPEAYLGEPAVPEAAPEPV